MMLLLCSCFSASSTGALGEDQDLDRSLKVMTYNIHHANPPLEPTLIDVDRIVEIIRSQNPDLVALQEVDANTNRSGAGNQAEQIARKLGMNYFFGQAISFDGGEYGVAILSRFPITERKVIKLPGEGGERRVLALVKIKLPYGQEVAFGSTHLDHRASETRISQIEKIIEVTSGHDAPTIIGGDFNAVPGSETINLVDDHFLRTCLDCEPTFPSNNPEIVIDFLVFKGKMRVKNHEVVQECNASDHLPVSAEIIFQ